MIRFNVDIQDRVFIQDFISVKETGNRIEMTLLYDLTKQVAFNPQEIETYGISMKGTRIEWLSNFHKEIELSDEQIDILLQCISIVADNNQISLPMIPLLDRIDNLNKK